MSRVGVTGILASLALVACGGHAADRNARPSAFCTREAGWIADSAAQMVHQFDHEVYPADVSLISFHGSMSQFRQRQCSASVLGRTVERRLSARQLDRLLEVLPPVDARAIRRAVAAA